MSEWISTEEETKPGNMQICLVTFVGCVQNCTYQYNAGQDDWQCLAEEELRADFNEFSHWQPLPSAPTT